MMILNRSCTKQRGFAAVAAALMALAAGAPIGGQATRPAHQPATQPASPPATRPAPPQPQLQGKLDRMAELVAGHIERAHGLSTWRTKSAVQADLTVEFAGEPTLQATLLYDIQRGRARLDLKDGTKLIYNGQKAWVSPAAASFKGARFHLLTWPRFLAAPFKLQERGVHPQAYRTTPLRGQPFDSFKLRIDTAVVDSPAQWLAAYAEQRSHQLHALAYTLARPESAAGENPKTQSQCVIFEDFKIIESVTLAQSWTFWNWDVEVRGDPIGKAKLADLKFIVPPPDAFDKPADAREDG